MTPQRWIRIAIGYLLIVSIQIGVWALVAPRSFYDDFPGLGRAWVSVDGPFNEHLIRDVGALNLALVVVLLAAFVRLTQTLVRVAAGAVLVWGLPHGIYHLAVTEGLGGGDLALSLGGLSLFVLLGGGLLLMSRELPGVSQ